MGGGEGGVKDGDNGTESMDGNNWIITLFSLW